MAGGVRVVGPNPFVGAPEAGVFGLCSRWQAGGAGYSGRDPYRQSCGLGLAVVLPFLTLIITFLGPIGTALAALLAGVPAILALLLMLNAILIAYFARLSCWGRPG